MYHVMYSQSEFKEEAGVDGVLVRELVRRNPLGETLWSGSGGGRAAADGDPASRLSWGSR
jgi:hypothetical protein